MGDAIHTNKEIIESDIRELNKDLLAVLLLDRTTHKNILWGTMDYSDEGSDYAAGDEIKVSLITGKNEGLIRPRIGFLLKDELHSISFINRNTLRFP